uniref:Uncharacterized protein n=1 Tax=Anguilla anguilla TaxID=7936 RepID=A0A0E9STT0_ANGAN
MINLPVSIKVSVTDFKILFLLDFEHLLFLLFTTYWSLVC